MLTTQYLDEADRLAHRIAVIDEGRVIAEGTPRELKAQVGGDRLEVQLGGSDGRRGAPYRRWPRSPPVSPRGGPAAPRPAPGAARGDRRRGSTPRRRRGRDRRHRRAGADAGRRLSAADRAATSSTTKGRRSGERGHRHARPREAKPAPHPSAADLLVGFTIQPVMFVLLFADVFGGAIETPGLDYVDFLIPGSSSSRWCSAAS